MDWVEFIILGKIPAKSSLQRISISKSGRPFMFTASAAKQYAKDFGKQLKHENKKYGEWPGGLNVQFTVYAEHRRQDIDSYSKILLDVMQEFGVIKNDNQVEELYIKRFVDKYNPRVEIKLWKGATL